MTHPWTRAAERTNADRANDARIALNAYEPKDQADDEANIVDLVADLYHLASSLGIDPEYVQRVAWHHYMAERLEDETREGA